MTSTLASIQEAAKLLGVSPQRVRRLCRDAVLHSEKVGNVWVVHRSGIESYVEQQSHLLVPNNAIRRNRRNKKPIALSFFSGAMGLDLGIEAAGFNVILACEFEKYSRQTIAFNKPEIALLEDINDCDGKDVLSAAGLSSKDDIDLIVGGPPCQAFSTAGKRKGFHDERGNVFLKYIELCLELRPKYFVIENVRGLLSCPLAHRPHSLRGKKYPNLSEDELRGGALNFVLHEISRGGYGYSFELYNSANFGTPQKRERVIIVCSRDGKKPPRLTPTHSCLGEHGLPKWNTLKPAIKGIRKHNHLEFPEKRLKYYRMLKPGQNWRDLPKELQELALGKSFYAGGGKTGFLRRLAWDKPSPTLVTHPAMPATDLAHPRKDRPLSIEEYKRIQEFPDDWIIQGSLIQQYKQVGNAVPISLGKAVGRLIMQLINDDEVRGFDGFRYSRYKNTSDAQWLKEFQKEIRKHAMANSQLTLKLD